MEEDRPVKSRGKTPRSQILITEIQQRSSAGLHDAKAVNPGGMRKDVIENAEFLQDEHAGRLEEETGAHGLAFGSALEKNDVVADPAQQHRGGWTCGSATDNCDAKGWRGHLGRRSIQPNSPKPVFTVGHDVEAHQEIGGRVHDDAGTQTPAPDT